MIPGTFKSKYLVISVICQNCRDTWHKAGYLTQIVEILPLKSVQVFDKKLILLNAPKLHIFDLFQSGYRLKFEPAKWIKEVILEIYVPKMPFYQPDLNSTPATTANVTSVTVANNTTPISLLAANNNRKRFSLRNRGSKPALIGFANNFNAANAYTTLAAGVVYESDINFTGEIFALGTAANQTTDIAVIEFV